jgi:hypothetical protein
MSLDEKVVFASNYTYGGFPIRPVDLFLQHDDLHSTNRLVFDGILKQMNEGRTGTIQFSRTNANKTEEHLQISFVPVMAQTLRAAHPEEYSTGAREESIQLYSLGIVRLQQTLEQPFTISKVASDNQLKAISIIVVLVNLLIALLSGATTIFVSSLDAAAKNECIAEIPSQSNHFFLLFPR